MSFSLGVAKPTNLGIPRPTIKVTPRPSRPKTSVSGQADQKIGPAPPTLIIPPQLASSSADSSFDSTLPTFETGTSYDLLSSLSTTTNANRGSSRDNKVLESKHSSQPNSKPPVLLRTSPTPSSSVATPTSSSSTSSSALSTSTPPSVSPTTTIASSSGKKPPIVDSKTSGISAARTTPRVSPLGVIPRETQSRNRAPRDQVSPLSVDPEPLYPTIENRQPSRTPPHSDLFHPSDQTDIPAETETSFSFDPVHVDRKDEGSLSARDVVRDDSSLLSNRPLQPTLETKEDRKFKILKAYERERRKLTLAEMNYTLVTVESEEDVKGEVEADGLKFTEKPSSRGELDRLRHCLYKLHALGVLYEPTLVPYLKKRVGPSFGSSPIISRILSYLPAPLSYLWRTPAPKRLPKSESHEEGVPTGVRLGVSASRLFDEFGHLINEESSFRSNSSGDGSYQGLTKTEGSIRSFAWHPFLDKWSVIAQDDQVYTYNMLEGTWEKLVLGHQFQIGARELQYCPMGGSMLAVACQNGICLWNLVSLSGTGSKKPSSKIIAERELPNAQSAWMSFLTRPGHQPIRGVQWSPCGRFLLSYTSLKTNSAGNKRKRGSLCISSFSTCDVVIWDVAKALTSEGSFPLKMLGGDAEVVRWSPRGNRLFISCADGTFSVWDTATWTRQVFSSKKGIQDAVWNCHGDFLLMCDKQSSVIYSLSFRRTHQVIHNQVWVDLARWCKGGEGRESEIPSGFASYLPRAFIKNLAWNQTSERLVVSFQGNKFGAEVLVLFDTEPGLVVKVHPIGLIRGPQEPQNGSSSKINKPREFHFQPNFHSGALLAIAWSQGYITYCPLLFASAKKRSA